MTTPEYNNAPGSYRIPKLPPGTPAQRNPGYRYHIATGTETLYGLAQELYGNPRRAVDIYNTNRSGRIRDDRAPGFISDINAPLPVGAIVLLP